MSKNAIVCISFGTSYNDTREKTIDVLEKKLQEAFPDRAFYRAWTSKMIIKKIEKRDGVKILTVNEVMEKMIEDGITDVIIQPTHIMNAIEHDIMKEDIASYKHKFDSIKLGAPLITTSQDKKEVIDALLNEFDVPKDEALIFMGHGSEHFANSIYSELDYTLKDMGHENICVATVEAYPDLDSAVKLVEKLGIKKVTLAPFMIVAGDHANNDLAGDEDDSWKSILEAKGFEVKCILKGIGEYPMIQDIFVRHAKEAK